MGIIADIYKAKGQSFSNGGLSEYRDQVTVVNVPGPFEPNAERPAVLLVEGNVPGSVKIVQAEQDGEGRWLPARPARSVGPMHGGCYVGTSDSRFGETVRELGGARFGGPVALHDRFESPELYRTLSL